MAVDLTSVGNASEVKRSRAFHPPTDSALNAHALATYRRPAAARETPPPAAHETASANTAIAIAADAMHHVSVARLPTESTRNALAMLPGRLAHATAAFSAYTFVDTWRSFVVEDPSASASRAKYSGSQSIMPYHPHDSENHTNPTDAALDLSDGSHRLRSGAIQAPNPPGFRRAAAPRRPTGEARELLTPTSTRASRGTRASRAFPLAILRITSVASSPRPRTARNLGDSGIHATTPRRHASAGAAETKTKVRQPRVGMSAHPMDAEYMDPTIHPDASATVCLPLA
mmetsp:Transcript_12106/g.54718  ORF Transcript_12106/g.54718 Transcript_12106/m.54718 type:complete len:287 (-) Transcript_12106:398-1258(-)